MRFLRRVDGELVNDAATRAELCAGDPRGAARRRCSATIPGSRTACIPTITRPGCSRSAAIVAARDPHFFPEQGLAPHRPDTLLLFEPARVDHLERVDDHVDRKVDALLAHRSQWRSTMAIDEADPSTATSSGPRSSTGVHDEARTAGLRAGLRAAEAFARIDEL